MDEAARQVLQNRMRRGELVLFTGAGFSADAADADGNTLPLGTDLREFVWRYAYPNDEFDTDSNLGDLYQLAIRRAQNRFGEALQRRLSVNASSLPSFYRIWFSVPWRIIYTLNIDNIDQVVQRQFNLPVPVECVSAIADKSLPIGGKLLHVHLNGRVEDYPNTTFSDEQYGERTAIPDPWYRSLTTDLSAYSVIFVGTVLDEPPLWQQVAVRRLRARRTRELRQRSFLVTPTLSRPRRDMLADLNVEWVPMTARQFAEEILAPMQPYAEEGHRELAVVRQPHPRAALLTPLSELQMEQRSDLADYLLGRQPSWADVIEGFAVIRSYESELAETVSREDNQIVFLSGTAGSGKTTTLMRLALALQVQGRDVRYLDTETELSIQGARNQIRQVSPSVLVIDDIDVFGTSSGQFLADVTDDNPNLLVLTAARSSRIDALDVARSLNDRRTREFVIPHLDDTDVDLLIDALSNANRLGKLRGLNRSEQRLAFRKRAGRQLIVALIEATSDERFEDRIRSECSDLSASEQLLYAVVSLASRFRQFLRRDEAMLAINGDRIDVLKDIDSLLRKQILVAGASGQLTARHRVIADEAMKFFRQSTTFADAVEGLLFAMATKAGGPEQSPRTREHRLLVRLLSNHFMLQEVPSVQRAREIYSSVESVLQWDFHYWLQRGALEVATEQLVTAEQFLLEARGLAEDDYRVQTEWALLQLKRACKEAEAGLPEASRRADTAFADLYDVIWRRGQYDSYPYHVLGSQGLAWSRRATMTRSDRVNLMGSLVSAVREGRKYHKANRELELLDSDLYVEYLRCSNG